MTAVPLGETPSLCILCPEGRERVARPGGMTDWVCHKRIGEQLDEIVQRYARLTPRPGGGQDFGRRAPGYHSRPPLKIHAAALRDPRTAPVELGELHAPLNLFISWATWIRGERRQQSHVAYPDDDLAALHFEWRYLTHALDWVTRQPWVPRFAEQVKACLSQMRNATGEPNPRPIGKCGECGHALFPPAQGKDVQCGGCRTPYDPLKQIRMVRKGKAQAASSEAHHGRCRACLHDDLQHSNDERRRPCNVNWCGCEGFEGES